jgi:hypothetical protein
LEVKEQVSKLTLRNIACNGTSTGSNYISYPVLFAKDILDSEKLFALCNKEKKEPK